jgi:hypothetical protein
MSQRDELSRQLAAEESGRTGDEVPHRQRKGW